MSTFVAMIGNSDNKLSQQEWSEFCKEFENEIRKRADQIFIVGHSNPDSKYQNMAIVFDREDDYCESALVSILIHFQTAFSKLAEKYNQDKIAILRGSEPTVMIGKDGIEDL